MWFRNFFLALVCVVVVTFIGCAGQNQQVIKHQLEISVANTADTPVDVKVEGVEKYALMENPALKLSRLTSTSSDGEAFVKIFSGLSVSDYVSMVNDFLYLYKETNIRTVHIYINSPGGDAFTGLALADTIVTFEKKGFTMIAHGSGIVASAAVPPFTVCTKRYAAPGTIFMVHEASIWKWPGQETASDIRSQNKLMEILQDRYLGYLVSRSKLSREEWIRLEKATTWFTAETGQAEIGIVDELE